MKACKVYCTEKGVEADAVILDNRVLLEGTPHGAAGPALEVDGACYCPPGQAARFWQDMDVAPFSVECAWGEYGDACGYNEDTPCLSDAGGNDPRPLWAATHNVDDIPTKWGYCRTDTGEIVIAPQWERCHDFIGSYAVVKGHDHYLINDDGDVVILPGWALRDIRLKPHGVALAQSISGHWGAFYPPDWGDDRPGVNLEWDGIWWDGAGAFTVLRRHPEGGQEYLLVNGNVNTGGDILISGLSQRPERHACMQESSYRDLFPRSGFSFIQRGGKYGIVQDLDNYASRLVVEPALTRRLALANVNDAELEAEIAYYARIISRTPRHFPGRDGDGWETVPEDIRDKVLVYMKANGMEQPETAAGLEEE